MEPGVIQAVDFHNYLGGNGSDVTSFVDPSRLDVYTDVVQRIIDNVQQSQYPSMPIWNSETGVTGGNSDSGFETKYVATFQLVEHLGRSAKMKLGVLTRQTFYGLWLGLIDDNLYPNPAYWFALLFKRLVDREVLDLSITGLDPAQNRLRLYAHCTSRAYVTANNLPAGAVTVYGMNLFDQAVLLNFGPMNVQLFLLTSDSLASNATSLNGVPLTMVDDEHLPPLKPVMVHGPGVNLPSRSVALVVLPTAGAKACA